MFRILRFLHNFVAALIGYALSTLDVLEVIEIAGLVLNSDLTETVLTAVYEIGVSLVAGT